MTFGRMMGIVPPSSTPEMTSLASCSRLQIEFKIGDKGVFIIILCNNGNEELESPFPKP